jgi:hypothetical protein
MDKREKLPLTIATLIRAFHRTGDSPSGPETLHTGAETAAAAIIDLLRADPTLLFQPNMFWDAAYPEIPIDSLDDVRDNTDFEIITEVWQGLHMPTIFVAWLPPRDDADGDGEPMRFEGNTLEAVQALMNEAQRKA